MNVEYESGIKVANIAKVREEVRSTQEEIPDDTLTEEEQEET